LSASECPPLAWPLDALPSLPRDADGPAFAEPWQAQAFALAVRLSEKGHFTWKEWAAALAAELRAAADRGESDDGSRYYEHWLAALERLVVEKGLATTGVLRARKDAWSAAYAETPHGVPVELRSNNTDLRWIAAGCAGVLAAVYAFPHAGVSSLITWSPRGAEAFATPTAVPLGLAASCAYGTLLGMRHAIEPDHLAAISTLLTGERTSARAAWLGACWGLGHTLTLLAAGAAMIALRADMPAVASRAFELCVVVLLIAFGGRAILASARRRSSLPTHRHSARASSRTEGRGWTVARRPLFVGAMHGLAGSGTLTALVIALLPSMAARLGYLTLFGVGSTIGMAVLSGLLGWPLARLWHHRWLGRGLSLLVGCASTALGLSWAYPMLARIL
jgi:nitrile hydratase accessory protein